MRSCCELLLKYSVDMAAADKSGVSSLHLAAEAGNLAMISAVQALVTPADFKVQYVNESWFELLLLVSYSHISHYL